MDDVINYCEVDLEWCYNEGICVFCNGEVSCLCLDGYFGDFCEYFDYLKEVIDEFMQYFVVFGIYFCYLLIVCFIINLYINFIWRMEE